MAEQGTKDEELATVFGEANEAADALHARSVVPLELSERRELPMVKSEKEYG